MELLVGDRSSFSDPGRRVFDIDGVQIGVFLLNGNFYAYENYCPHSGGPVCQGKILPLTLEDVAEDRTSQGRIFSQERMNMVCPWHGMEFDITTGRHPTNQRLKLKAVPVKVKGDQIYLDLPLPSARDGTSSTQACGS